MCQKGKVYRSEDNGETWIESFVGLPATIDLDKFLLSPTGKYYLSLLYGGGVYTFDPATGSWSETVTGLSGWNSYDGFDIDPQGRMWVSRNESNNQIYYSTNEGQSFQNIPLVTPMNGWFEALATFNNDHNLFSTDEKVYHFNINGESQLVMNDLTILKWIGYNPYTGTAYCSDYEALKRSTDGGVTWQAITALPNEYYPYVQNITFEAGGKTWIHTFYGQFYSIDDGEHWDLEENLSKVNAAFYRGNNDDWFVSATCGFPDFARSGDGGLTWTDLSQQFQFPNVKDIKIDKAGVMYAKTCRFNAFEKSVDGGQTWTDLLVQDSVQTRVTSLAFGPDGVMVAAGANKMNYRSLDNGANWVAMLNLQVPVYSQLKFYCDFQGIFYALESYGDIWKSVDNGATWQYFWLGVELYETDLFIHPNGDIFFIYNSIPGAYTPGTNSIHWLSSNDIPFLSPYRIHCTANGTTYLTTYSSSVSLYRILSDGQYALEPIPFFESVYIEAIASNAEGDVFVAASGDIYKSEDNGLTWVKMSAMPDKGNLQTLYVAPDQYLYAGYDGDVIYRSAQPTAQDNLILGKVWLDANSDCLYDAGETYQTSVAVTASGNGDYTSFSGYNGNFILSAPSGTYALQVQPPNALYAPCLPDASITLDGPGDSATVDLPLRAVAQCPYLSVSLTTPILRRCFDVTYTVRYKNEGTALAEDASVQVTLDSFFVFQSSSLPVATQNGFTYTFNLDDLAPGQSGSFNILVQVSCGAALGQTHCVSAQIYPDQLCLPTLPPLAFYRECRQNIGSFDPNDKRAFVDGREEPGYVLPDTDIEYLIRFQNTGTDTAFRVVVEDRLSPLLDLASVTPLVASHPYEMEVKDQRTLRFVFDHILLPDSNLNEAASHGFIKFRVAQVPNVPLGSVIRNEADIFFDFNAPVRTNESKLVVGVTGTRPEPGNPYTVLAYPNPFGASVRFEVEGPALFDPLSLRLFDALGRQVRREEFSGTTFTLERAALEAGLYYFLVESEGRRVGAGKVEAR